LEVSEYNYKRVKEKLEKFLINKNFEKVKNNFNFGIEEKIEKIEELKSFKKSPFKIPVVTKRITFFLQIYYLYNLNFSIELIWENGNCPIYVLKKNIFPEDITLESYDDTRGRKFYKL
jgi:hypothetical protein